ncbi:MAG: adenylyltransferase/cytidyltransferase family protein [Candidatus Bathyarchaeia archaeon]
MERGVGAKKIKVVLAEGTFDLLHYGHVYYLTGAKRAGGENSRLIVIVARDKTVEKLKGRKPVIPEDQRRAIVEALKVVDEAILGFEEMDMVRVIEKIKPDIIALGYDKEEIEKNLKKYIEEKKLGIEVIRIGRFEGKEPISSSDIRRKIIEEYQSQSNLNKWANNIISKTL